MVVLAHWRPLQEKGTNRSSAQPAQRRRTKPCSRRPQARNSRNSRSTNQGRPLPSSRVQRRGRSRRDARGRRRRATDEATERGGGSASCDTAYEPLGGERSEERRVGKEGRRR